MTFLSLLFMVGVALAGPNERRDDQSDISIAFSVSRPAKGLDAASLEVIREIQEEREQSAEEKVRPHDKIDARDEAEWVKAMEKNNPELVASMKARLPLYLCVSRLLEENYENRSGILGINFLLEFSQTRNAEGLIDRCRTAYREIRKISKGHGWKINSRDLVGQISVYIEGKEIDSDFKQRLKDLVRLGIEGREICDSIDLNSETVALGLGMGFAMDRIRCTSRLGRRFSIKKTGMTFGIGLGHVSTHLRLYREEKYLLPPYYSVVSSSLLFSQEGHLQHYWGDWKSAGTESRREKRNFIPGLGVFLRYSSDLFSLPRKDSKKLYKQMRLMDLFDEALGFGKRQNPGAETALQQG